MQESFSLTAAVAGNYVAFFAPSRHNSEAAGRWCHPWKKEGRDELTLVGTKIEVTTVTLTKHTLGDMFPDLQICVRLVFCLYSD